MQINTNTDPLTNRFKARLANPQERQIGLWMQIASNITAEALAYSGYDWLLIDAEHAPNDVHTILPQLQAMATGNSAPMVRPGWNDQVQIKRLLDIGVQTFLVPFVQNAEEAYRAARAVRYPPEGSRGVSTFHRGNRYGHAPDYLKRANDEVCMIVQIETRAAIDRIREIAATPGVDAVFVGPSDLAADLGHLGNPSHPEVQSAIAEALGNAQAAGTPAGIFALGPEDARKRFDAGFQFASIGADLSSMVKACENMLAIARG
jgi:4-hydroxy-2-oxoheptanedioate aldolase